MIAPRISFTFILLMTVLSTNLTAQGAVVGGVSIVPAQQTAAQPSLPLVRQGEFEAAPWLDDIGSPSNTGRLLLSPEIPGTAMRPEEKTTFVFAEQIYVVPPSGGTAAVGQTFVAFAKADVIGEGQVLVPTGILRIVQSGAAGEAAIAQVVKQFGPITMHNLLVPATSLGTPRTGTLTPVSGGASGKVTWVSNGHVLPTLHSYAIVDAGAAAGVRLGDIFTLHRPRKQHTDGTWLPEKEIARARVVKVTPRGTTVLIIDQTEPAISVGTAARLTARAP